MRSHDTHGVTSYSGVNAVDAVCSEDGSVQIADIWLDRTTLYSRLTVQCCVEAVGVNSSGY